MRNILTKYLFNLQSKARNIKANKILKVLKNACKRVAAIIYCHHPECDFSFSDCVIYDLASYLHMTKLRSEKW